jgi:hypothetical protein
MPDDPSKRGPQDSSRVNIHESWELEYWCKQFNVKPSELKDCVRKVGAMVEDVKKCLGHPK